MNWESLTLDSNWFRMRQPETEVCICTQMPKDVMAGDYILMDPRWSRWMVLFILNPSNFQSVMLTLIWLFSTLIKSEPCGCLAMLVRINLNKPNNLQECEPISTSAAVLRIWIKFLNLGLQKSWIQWKKLRGVQHFGCGTIWDDQEHAAFGFRSQVVQTALQ